MGAAAPELDRLEDELKFTLGGGALSRLALSLGGGGGGGAENEEGARMEMLPLDVLFVVVLLDLMLDVVGAGVYASVVGGGGGMTRLGPLLGK